MVLPKRNITIILEQISADEEHHLVVMFAYPEREALETMTYFENMLRKKYLNYQLNKNSDNFLHCA